MNNVNAGSNLFDWSRFARVFSNDLAQQWRRIWIATLAMFSLGLIAYLTNVEPENAGEPQLFLALFPVALLGGGLLFTASIFAELQHPLQRFQYLMLPCSNLERFLSRYLLSGPLLFIYMVVLYAIFDAGAGMLAQAWLGKRAASFDLTMEPVWQVSLGYFFLHSCMLLGAVYFRSYALIKTGLAGAVLYLTMSFVHVMGLRLVYWEYYSGFFPTYGAVLPAPGLMLTSLASVLSALFLLHAWLLYLTYATLCDYEVQG